MRVRLHASAFRWSGTIIALTVLFAYGLCAAEAAEVVDLDFSQAQTGCLPNKMAAEKMPAVVATLSVYGRLRGESAIPEAGTRYAGAALGRGGELNALRLGDGGQKLGTIGHRFQSGITFALELWVYVYDARHYFSGSILSISQSYKHGLSLGFDKQKWSVNGWLNLSWGTTEGADSIHLQEFLPEKWHHIIINYDTKSLSLYVDGKLSGRKDAALIYKEDRGELFVGPLDFKLDQLTVHTATLSEDEITAKYAKGKPEQTFSPEQEARLTALQLQIPHETFGYFQTEQKIPVLIDEAAEADELVVNGVKHILPLKEPVMLSFSEPGMREITLALTTRGKMLKQVAYPVAIVPFAMESSKLGAGGLASRQPEVRALGIRLARVVVDWAELEPRKQDYEWKRLDAVMARNRELGAETILCLTGIPGWAKLPRDMASYVKLWRLLANRYEGVKLYELWNATTPGTSIDRKEYLPLLRAAAETLRKDVPDAKILAGRIDIGDGVENAAWLQQNAAAWYDIFSAGKYSVDPAKEYAKSPWSANIIKAAGKPVWNTASGIQQPARTTLVPSEKPAAAAPTHNSWPIPTVDESTGAAWQIQDLALQLADGIERVILESGPSEYSPINNPTTGLPGAKGLALAVFNGLVGKDARLSRLPDVTEGVFTVCFKNPDGRKGLILFTAGGESVLRMIPAAPGAQLIDLFGKTIPLQSGEIAVSARPVYVLNVETITNKEKQ